MDPPIAPKLEFNMRVGDDVRLDSYHWLRDKNHTDQRVYQYLKVCVLVGAEASPRCATLPA